MATSDKYDRQLRLWGSNGQKALMNSKILLINADSVGTETLKNLVLPGVGMFTILDDFIVDQDDLGSNFFVLPNCLGKPRAEIVTELLCEMNSDVTGYARVANFQNVFQTEPEYFTAFNLIITANMAEKQLRPLAELCWRHGIPLLISRAYGLIGTVRLQLKEHDIIESRPEADRFDLRIANPFPDLVSYCDSIDLDSLSSIEHSHIPYIVILYKAIQKWRQQNNDKIPSNAAEKAQFRDQIKGMSRNFNNETNFQEAVKESYRAYGCHEFSEELQSVLENHSDSSALNANSKQFSFLATALSLFLQSNGRCIPLSGQIPDLTSTTELYVQLQQIYMKKATEDLKAFKQILQGLLEGVGLPSSTVPDDLIDTFCKNALNLQTVSTRPLSQELSESPECGVVSEVLQDELYDDPLQTPILWYLALRATDSFHTKYARYPGEQEDPTVLAADEDQVYKELVQLCTQQYQVDSALLEGKDADAMSMEDGTTAAPTALVTRAHAVEITRYGGCELHNISALIGGIAAQEAVKIITHQYVPLNNTYIYNGIAACGATYEL